MAAWPTRFTLNTEEVSNVNGGVWTARRRGWLRASTVWWLERNCWGSASLVKRSSAASSGDGCTPFTAVSTH